MIAKRLIALLVISAMAMTFIGPVGAGPRACPQFDEPFGAAALAPVPPFVAPRSIAPKATGSFLNQFIQDLQPAGEAAALNKPRQNSLVVDTYRFWYRATPLILKMRPALSVLITNDENQIAYSAQQLWRPPEASASPDHPAAYVLMEQTRLLTRSPDPIGALPEDLRNLRLFNNMRRVLENHASGPSVQNHLRVHNTERWNDDRQQELDVFFHRTLSLYSLSLYQAALRQGSSNPSMAAQAEALDKMISIFPKSAEDIVRMIGTWNAALSKKAAWPSRWESPLLFDRMDRLANLRDGFYPTLTLRQTLETVRGLNADDPALQNEDAAQVRNDEQAHERKGGSIALRTTPAPWETVERIVEHFQSAREKSRLTAPELANRLPYPYGIHLQKVRDLAAGTPVPITLREAAAIESALDRFDRRLPPGSEGLSSLDRRLSVEAIKPILSLFEWIREARGLTDARILNLCMEAGTHLVVPELKLIEKGNRSLRPVTAALLRRTLLEKILVVWKLELPEDHPARKPSALEQRLGDLFVPWQRSIPAILMDQFMNGSRDNRSILDLEKWLLRWCEANGEPRVRLSRDPEEIPYRRQRWFNRLGRFRRRLFEFHVRESGADNEKESRILYRPVGEQYKLKFGDLVMVVQRKIPHRLRFFETAA